MTIAEHWQECMFGLGVAMGLAVWMWWLLAWRCWRCPMVEPGMMIKDETREQEGMDKWTQGTRVQ